MQFLIPEINQGNAAKCRFEFGKTTFPTGNKNEK